MTVLNKTTLQKKTKGLLLTDSNWKISGQDAAISLISKAVRRARSGLKNPKRPIGCFLFLGPTGVGKTHTVKKLSEFLFGSEDNLVR